jgi:hypothetical protein
MLFPSLGLLRRLEAGTLVLAACTGIVALAFYWSRYWVQFNLAAIPWVALSLAPYAIHGLVASRLARRSESRGAAAAALLGAIALLLVSAWFYLPFLDESTVFYLRWTLGLGIPVLGGIGLVTSLITWLLARLRGAS